jgi:hypothetical protein
MEKVFPRTYWLRGRAFGSFSELRESKKLLNESVDKKDTQGIGLLVGIAKKQKMESKAQERPRGFLAVRLLISV